jgi:hypothetical protein
VARLQGRSAISLGVAAEGYWIDGCGAQRGPIGREVEGWIRSTLQAAESTAALLRQPGSWAIEEVVRSSSSTARRPSRTMLRAGGGGYEGGGDKLQGGVSTSSTPE